MEVVGVRVKEMKGIVKFRDDGKKGGKREYGGGEEGSEDGFEMDESVSLGWDVGVVRGVEWGGVGG